MLTLFLVTFVKEVGKYEGEEWKIKTETAYIHDKHKDQEASPEW